MNTFWGSDTDALTTVSETFEHAAERLGDLTTTLTDTAHTVPWIGPDADDWRTLHDRMMEKTREVGREIARLARRLFEESREQEECSRADGSGDGSPTRGAPPPERDFGNQPFTWPPRPGFMPREAQGQRDPLDLPTIFGPMIHPDPIRLGEKLRDLPLPSLKEVWGPFQHEPLPGEPPPREPVPRDDQYALDPEVLEQAQKGRRKLLGAIPLAGTAQWLLPGHEIVGQALDGVERGLENAGLGVLTPALTGPKMMHSLSGIAIGERSTFAQVVEGMDHGFAGALQTTQELSEAVGERDAAAAARTLERGMYRQAGSGAEILTAFAAPAVIGGAGEMIGHTADVVEVASPQAAAPLHRTAEEMESVASFLEEGRDRITDAQAAYELRRTYVPLPWDERG
ncbi:hypothetical protein [Brachybacterium sp. UMB0905]|uniref:hypothetical protein n=1 Tax=Brachybacterium sp. UMB0905 TaxID=2069310 RepID=UPI000C80DB7A|nr:hypothetical protein [Brachybacterium sp. UMB0905]PMC74438.1 hypothetical protein CJ197_13425 [Brachybacterium sp. UMB0905]